jgi:hypothetical protein
MVSYFSAEPVEATSRHPRRLRVRNRMTGETYFRPYPWVGDKPTDAGLIRKVVEIHTSPVIELRVLWYDEQLNAVFFATKLRRM